MKRTYQKKIDFIDQLLTDPQLQDWVGKIKRINSGTLPFFKLFDSSINKILKKFEVGFAYSTYSEGSMLLHGSTMEQFIHIGDSIVAPKIIPQKDFIESEFQSIIERCRMIFVYLAAIEQYILKKPELRR
jgi:hypothetical protein